MAKRKIAPKGSIEKKISKVFESRDGLTATEVTDLIRGAKSSTRKTLDFMVLNNKLSEDASVRPKLYYSTKEEETITSTIETPKEPKISDAIETIFNGLDSLMLNFEQTKLALAKEKEINSQIFGQIIDVYEKKDVLKDVIPKETINTIKNYLQSR